MAGPNLSLGGPVPLNELLKSSGTHFFQLDYAFKCSDPGAFPLEIPALGLESRIRGEKHLLLL